MKKILLSVSAASVLAVSQAYAQADTSGIDQRQANQEQRIDKGIAGGQLNEREANRLNSQQEHVNKMENKAKSDGVVTKKERARLHAAQNRTSQKIVREKHDRQKNPRQ